MVKYSRLGQMALRCIYEVLHRFCPSIFLYLCCLVPPIWFLELKMLANRIEERDMAMLRHHKQNQKETMTSLLDSNLTDIDYEPEEILIEIAEGVKVAEITRIMQLIV